MHKEAPDLVLRVGRKILSQDVIRRSFYHLFLLLPIIAFCALSFHTKTALFIEKKQNETHMSWKESAFSDTM